MSEQEESQVVTLLLRIIDRQEKQDAKLDGHIKNEEGMLAGVSKSFPLRADGTPDFEGHQAYHIAIIEESRERAQMWRELRTDLAKKSLWGLVLVLGALILYWWKHEVKGP